MRSVAGDPRDSEVDNKAFSRTSERLVLSLVSATVLFGTVLIGGNAAHAQSASAAVTTTSRTFVSSEISSFARQASTLRTTDVQGVALATNYEDQQARAGNLVDTKNVKVARLPDPHLATDTIDLVWSGSRGPGGLTYSRDERAGSHRTAVALKVGDESLAVPATPKVAPNGGAGAGFDNANSWTGSMKPDDDGCMDAYYTEFSSGGVKSHLMSCFESFHLVGTVYWVYNRWGLWTPAPAQGTGAERDTTDYYVASRPWKGTGYADRITSLVNFLPPTYYSSCPATYTNLELSATVGAITGKVNIPFTQCDDYLQTSSAGSKTIGIDLFQDGLGYGSNKPQIRMDVAGKFKAKNTTVQALWADYNYVESQYCDVFNCEAWPVAHALKDSGW